MKSLLLIALAMLIQADKPQPKDIPVQDLELAPSVFSGFTLFNTSLTPPCGNFGARVVDGRCQLVINFYDKWEDLKCTQHDQSVICTWKPLPDGKEKPR